MRSLRLALVSLAVGVSGAALAQSLRAPAPSLRPTSPPPQEEQPPQPPQPAAGEQGSPLGSTPNSTLGSTPGGALGSTPGSALGSMAGRPAPKTSGVGLRGWADLHTHPLSNLGFGGKLVDGGVDVGSLLPADAKCQHYVRATSMEQALGTDNGVNGGWGTDNGCGDDIRKQVIQGVQKANGAVVTPDWARGAEDFRDWPRWNDITHQKMWVDWIRRAHDGGLRVMVALAVNNKTLADAVSGPGDGPTDDKASADRQIAETKAFVGRHRDFMEVAYTPQDLERIVRADKTAVVLGVETDDIGDFNRVASLSNAMISAEIDRLYREGVRYVFPIHVIDNPFGGTAVYEAGFNTSNYREAGHFWDLGCAAPGDRITYKYHPEGFDLALALVKTVKLGMDGFRNPPTPPACPTGHVNRRGLTPQGEYAIREMMRRGMLIDIDHMSQLSANRALQIAEAVPGGYPLNSGHNCLRGRCGQSENSRTVEQYRKIAALGGMAGVGTAGLDAYTWIRDYHEVVQAMGSGGAGLGTDMNGLVKGPAPRPHSNVRYDARFPESRTGTRAWDYNRMGVAQYGMLWDFLKDAATAPGGLQLIRSNLESSADAFWRMWQKCEAERTKVR